MAEEIYRTLGAYLTCNDPGLVACLADLPQYSQEGFLNRESVGLPGVDSKTEKQKPMRTDNKRIQ